MKIYIALLVSIFSSIVTANESVKDWPELKGISYVSGRAATEKDISDGVAVFLLKSEGVAIGKPLPIKIPQYAIHINVDSGDKTRVIIIQAESANGQDIIGALDIDTNGFMAGLANEYKLLGTVKPN